MFHLQVAPRDHACPAAVCTASRGPPDVAASSLITFSSHGLPPWRRDAVTSEQVECLRPLSCRKPRTSFRSASVTYTE